MDYYDFYQNFHEQKSETPNTASINPLDHVLSAFTKNKIDHSATKNLTSTEKKICIGLALGLTAKEIAKTRGSSNRTIETHIANIKMKIGCKRLPPILLMHLMLSRPLSNKKSI